MSRLFYHVMQDSVGNLLFDVTGTMRIAGSGTLATIYGDEALTVILPNPMTNHPSFGSFKCFLGAGDYDFYMAKGGYTFETLTGVQGHGTMAQQDASAVAITGGTAQLTTLGIGVAPALPLDVSGIARITTLGLNRAPQPGYDLATVGDVLVGGHLGISTTAAANIRLAISFDKTNRYGLKFNQTVNDTGPGQPILFNNTADALVGSISTTVTVTAYNTSSDARLKDDVQPLTGALDVIRALHPVSFVWKADGSPGRGFLAQQVQEVIPDGVISGERDAVDEDGGIMPQMIDYSKLVPYLIGAVKELTQQVEMLTAKLAGASA